MVSSNPNKKQIVDKLGEKSHQYRVFFATVINCSIQGKTGKADLIRIVWYLIRMPAVKAFLRIAYFTFYRNFPIKARIVQFFTNRCQNNDKLTLMTASQKSGNKIFLDKNFANFISSWCISDWKESN